MIINLNAFVSIKGDQPWIFGARGHPPFAAEARGDPPWIKPEGGDPPESFKRRNLDLKNLIFSVLIANKNAKRGRYV